MIEKKYDSHHLDRKQAAAVLEVDTSQVSRMFRSGRIKSYYNAAENEHFTTEADIISYLASRLPSGYSVTTSKDDDLNHV